MSKLRPESMQSLRGSQGSGYAETAVGFSMRHVWNALALSGVILSLTSCSAGLKAGRSDFTACELYPSQKAAQVAWEDAGRTARWRLDVDKDGKVCEELEKPRMIAGRQSGDPPNCRKVKQVVEVALSRSRSPESVRHIETAVNQAAYPSVLTIDRHGSDLNRRQVLELRQIDDKPGFAHHQYPPAIAAEGGVFESGGMIALVRLIPERDNASSAAKINSRLSKYCSGQRFRLVAR